MSRFIRILVALLALAGVTAWTFLTVQIWHWGRSFTGFGAGDGGPASSPSGGAVLFGVLLVSAIWAFPVSPYIGILVGSFNLITGKLLRYTYVYALVVLVPVTVIQLLTFQLPFEFMALGNILACGLWRWGLLAKSRADPNTYKSQ